jgi:hypothetical protein
MIAISFYRSWFRARRLGTSLLLLLLPACGLSDYEALMRETQEREQRFNDEKKYLDAPVQMPKLKDKDGKEKPAANVFFRPPMGIQSKPESLNDSLWRYPARARGGAFSRVELAFAEDSKDFASDVFLNYKSTAQARARFQEFTPLDRKTPLVYDIWEFDDGQESYAINILRGGKPHIAIVFVYNRAHGDTLRKVMDLSLESLAIDQQASAASQRYAKKSPWQLQTTRAP